MDTSILLREKIGSLVFKLEMAYNGSGFTHDSLIVGSWYFLDKESLVL